jgi:hypothetical protein
MLTVRRGTASTCSRVTRRGFLRVGGLGALGLTVANLPALAASGPGPDRAVIFLTTALQMARNRLVLAFQLCQ